MFGPGAPVPSRSRHRSSSRATRASSTARTGATAASCKVRVQNVLKIVRPFQSELSCDTLALVLRYADKKGRLQLYQADVRPMCPCEQCRAALMSAIGGGWFVCSGGCSHVLVIAAVLSLAVSAVSPAYAGPPYNFGPGGNPNPRTYPSPGGYRYWSGYVNSPVDEPIPPCY